MRTSTIPYWQQLLDPRWQKKRLEILNRANFRCEDCGDDQSTLSVHHITYEKGLMAWEYHNDNFKALCGPCHEFRAEAERAILVALRTAQWEYVHDLAVEFTRAAHVGRLNRVLEYLIPNMVDIEESLPM